VKVAPATVEHAAAASRLRAATSRLTRMLRQETSVGDLTLSQWSALATVEESGPLRIGELAEREHMSAPTATRVTAALEERGFVTRLVDSTDRRSALLSLTTAGAAMLQHARRARTAQLAGRLSRLDPADLDRLVLALPVLEQLTRD